MQEAELDEDDLELIREARKKMRSTRSSAQAEKSELGVKPESGLLKTTFWSFLAVLGLPVVVLLQLTMAGKQRCVCGYSLFAVCFCFLMFLVFSPLRSFSFSCLGEVVSPPFA